LGGGDSLIGDEEAGVGLFGDQGFRNRREHIIRFISFDCVEHHDRIGDGTAMNSRTITGILAADSAVHQYAFRC